MKQHVLFIGNKFIFNKSLKEYILRKIEKQIDFISSVVYFQENDNSLFLYLETEINSNSNLIIITTKNNFSTVGKLISTITGDNQILKENILIPSRSKIYKDCSYLLEYQNKLINVLHIDEMQEMPDILIKEEVLSEMIHIFEEEKESIHLILNPIAQMYDVKLDIITLVEQWQQIVISSNKYGNISKFIVSAKQLLPNKLIESDNPVQYIIEILAKNSKKITFAESCTGGLLTYYFTEQNGASQILDGSLITYSNSLKENWLGISSEIINKNGAVSSKVVEEMSEGAISVSSADYSISVSGIAGEGGGSKEKPVGTVYIGVRSKENNIEKKLHFKGDRNYIQKQSCLEAIKMLLIIDKEMFF